MCGYTSRVQSMTLTLARPPRGSVPGLSRLPGDQLPAQRAVRVDAGGAEGRAEAGVRRPKWELVYYTYSRLTEFKELSLYIFS